MTDSIFNAEQFLDQVVEGAMDTRVVPCPEGDWQMEVKSYSARTWKSKDGTKAGVALDLIWNVTDYTALTTAGVDELSCKQGIMLDITPEGKLDTGKGKNIRLGRLREALGLNEKDQPFSFALLTGRVAVGTVTHRTNDEGEVFAEVKSVAKFG